MLNTQQDMAKAIEDAEAYMGDAQATASHATAVADVSAIQAISDSLDALPQGGRNARVRLRRAKYYVSHALKLAQAAADALA